MTIQVRPQVQRDPEADVARAADLARRTRGVEATQPFTKAESERLLEPWLGTGLSFSDLPVPRIIVVKLVAGETPDLEGLRQALREQVPGATLDDHALWLSRLSTMANTVVGVGLALVILVLVAAGLAVTFATRGAMAGNHEVVEVLHFVGADDDYIARVPTTLLQARSARQRRGSAAAIAVTAVLGWITSSLKASPAGDQIEALFGSFGMSWRGYMTVIVIALIVSALTGIVSLDGETVS